MKNATNIFFSLLALTLGVQVIEAGSMSATKKAFNPGFIDIEKVMMTSQEGKNAQDKLKKKQDDFKKRAEPLEKELQKLVTDAQTKRGTMSAEAQQKLEKDFQGKYMEMENMKQEFTQAMSQYEAEVVEKVKSTGETFRKENNLSAVLDSKSGTIIAIDPAFDVTDAFIAKMDKGTAPVIPAKK